jgi:osmotically-inducible protein OsmY
MMKHQRRDEPQPLLRRVENILRTNPYVRRGQIRCEEHQGRIVLSGAVASYYQKQMAQEAVLAVEGVSEVENRLQVEPPAWTNSPGEVSSQQTFG